MDMRDGLRAADRPKTTWQPPPEYAHAHKREHAAGDGLTKPATELGDGGRYGGKSPTGGEGGRGSQATVGRDRWRWRRHVVS